MKWFSRKLISSCLLAVFILFNYCKTEVNELPELVTVPASDIKSTSAVVGGQVGNDGGSEVIVRGVCFGRNADPDISGLKSTRGKGTGTYTCTLTGLIPDALYYVRAFATNSEGTAYGGEVRFSTIPAQAPVVISLNGSKIPSFYSAWIGGQVEDDGGAPVIERGICWGPTENPDIISNNKVVYTDPVIVFNASFYCMIFPLQPGTDYHARAYAINAVGTSFGNDMIIKTLAVPEVNTLDASDITTYTAKVRGKIISQGDVRDQIEVGICYGTEKDPTLNNNYIIGNPDWNDEFICSLYDLKPGTTYYARAYVYWIINMWPGEPTVYGNEISFKTSD